MSHVFVQCGGMSRKQIDACNAGGFAALVLRIRRMLGFGEAPGRDARAERDS